MYEREIVCVCVCVCVREKEKAVAVESNRRKDLLALFCFAPCDRATVKRGQAVRAQPL